LSGAGTAPRAVMNSWQRPSSSSVVTPGFTCPTIMSSVSAASRPAARMPSKAAASCSLIWPVLRTGALSAEM
jgi:hypothetical protein